ncbi:hypothetical protein EG68_02852 [Paragonimus skrjabini miyazakii]|uniref:Uncharacterized protein n=1 Tax=Paragonimus skrjabini miyazakii TaxID=59628 RepID=A0A8S9Z9V2_9TREM|nr:hypothetical protein EG68_02852 [Paragonimus skrjabini miyazakii]
MQCVVLIVNTNVVQIQRFAHSFKISLRFRVMHASHPNCQLEGYEEFLVQIYKNVLRVSVAAYVCMQTPAEMDVEEFARFIQQQYNIREEQKEYLMRFFNSQEVRGVSAEDIVCKTEECIHTTAELQIKETKMETFLKMLMFKLEYTSDYRLLTEGDTLGCVLEKYIILSERLFHSCYKKRKELKLMDSNNLKAYNRAYNENKKILNLWCSMAFNKTIQPTSLHHLLSVISKLVDKLADSEVLYSPYWKHTILEIVQSFGAGLSSLSSDSNKHLIVAFMKFLINTCLKFTEAVWQDITDKSGLQCFNGLSEGTFYLWLLLTFLKYFSKPIVDSSTVKVWCSQLEVTSKKLTRAEGLSNGITVQNSSCIFLMFLLRNRFMKISSN